MESENNNKRAIHRNYIIASNLIFAMAAWVIIDYFLFSNKPKDHYQLTLQIVLAIIGISLGLRVRGGDYRIKYRLTLIVVLASLAYAAVIVTTGISTIKQNIPKDIEVVISVLVFVCILVLLFRVPKEIDDETKEQI